jgi:hypothetical protein
LREELWKIAAQETSNPNIQIPKKPPKPNIQKQARSSALEFDD